MRRRILTGLLCFCMIFQNITATVHAEADSDAAEVMEEAEEQREEDIPALPEEESAGTELPDDAEEELSAEQEPPVTEVEISEEAELPLVWAEEKKEYTSDEVESLVVGLPQMHIYTNLTTALSDEMFGDIKYDADIEKGWHWKREEGIKEMPLLASDAAPEQTYTAVYEQEGYKDLEVPLDVRITKIDKISLRGDAYLTPKHDSGLCYLDIKTTGSEVTEDELKSVLDVQWTLTTKGVVSYTDDNILERGITAEKPGTDTVTAAVCFKGVERYKNNLTKFVCRYNVNVTEQSMADRLWIGLAEDGEHTNFELDEGSCEYDDDTKSLQEIFIDLNILKDSGNKTDTQELEIHVYEGEEELPDAAVSWKSSDSSVASVRMVKGVPVLTVKKKGGTAVLTATSRDKKKCQDSFTVRVLDYTPVVEKTSFVLNKYRTSGEEVLLLPMNGNGIANVQILEYDKNSREYVESDKFYAEQKKGEDDIWLLSLEDAAKDVNKKQSYNCMLLMDTDEGEFEKKIKITVDTAKPKATLKVVRKLNIFRLNERGESVESGEYTVNSKYEIENIVWEPYDDSKVHISGVYDSSTGKICFSAKKMNRGNYTDLLNSRYAGRKGKITISFKGYSEEANYTFDRVADVVCTQNVSYMTAPITVCPEQGLLGNILEVTEKSTGQRVIFGSGDAVTPISSGVELTRIHDGELDLTYSGASGTTAKLRWDSASYVKPITLSVRINVIGRTPQFQLSNSTMVLNTMIENEAAVSLGVKGSNYYTVDSCEITKPSAFAKLEDEGIIETIFDEDDQQIRVKVKKPEKITKAVSYRLILGGTMADGEVTLAKTTLNVKFIVKAPSVRVTGKGTINLLNRENTEIIYKPVLSNISGALEDAELLGGYAEYFHVYVDDDGNIRLSASESAPLRNKVRYQIRMKLTYDGGYHIVTPVISVTPAEKLPKLTANIKKTTIYRFNPIESSFRVSVPAESGVKIEDIRLAQAKNSDYFEYTYEEDGSGIIALKEDSAIKAGTYSLSFYVYYEGRGITSKPVTVKLSVVMR